MKLYKLTLTLGSSIIIGAAFVPRALAEPLTFQSAVAEYKAGKYSSALVMFKAFAKASPNNVLVHYYLAMCHHNMGHVDQARQEYNFVVAKGEPSYKALAEKGLTRLTGSPAAAGASNASQDQNAPSQVAPARRAKKVIDFYADWWGPCKTFAPVFDAVKKNSKYKDVQFQSLDLDENEAVAERYNVESIPTVVILSGSGEVLYNDHPPMDKASFEEVINRFH